MNQFKIAPLENFPEFAETGKKEALKAEISHLLENNKDRLVHAMYRLDVAEKDFLNAFDLSGNSDIAENLCSLVLARIEQIIASRKAHRAAGNQPEWTEKDADW